MRRKTIIKFEHWLAIVVYWIIAFYLYYLIAFWGTQKFLAESKMKEYLDTPYVHIEIIMQATLFGSLFYLISLFVSNSRIKRKSFGVVIITHSALYALAIIVVAVIVFYVFVYFDIYPKKELYVMQEAMISSHYFISLFIYVTGAILALNFLVEVDKKFGPGNLFRLFVGKYHKPREEQRIFMFLDMNNSTGIAEKLGHRLYSRFIRDCFHDLTDLIIRYRAEIYQFVGDEVVLSWNLKKGLKKNNCLHMFFEYVNLLEKNSKYYLDKYGISPGFKAGMEVGVVTVSEIGDIKREIAYHGDVLNTAARLQELCKTYKSQLLISRNLNDVLGKANGFLCKPVGKLKLRGKNIELQVFSIELK